MSAARDVAVEPRQVGRVLYVHRTRGRGVEGVHIKGIVDGLRARGYEVDFVAPDSGVDSSAQTPASNPSKRNPLLAWLSEHAPEFLFEFAEIAYNGVAWRALQSKFKAGTTKFIYERYAIFAVSAAFFARARNLPLVLEVNYTACSPLVRKRTSWLKFLARWADRRIFARATVLVAVSSTLRRELIELYRVPAEKIVVSPNAADPAQFDPSAVTPIDRVEDRSLDGKYVIGFVGSFAPWHGVDLLVHAFATIATAVPDALLVLIGDGPERENIRLQAARAGLADRVLMTGVVPHRDLGRYVARFDVAVMADSNDYGSPMKIFEYMAMGRAVVAPDYAPILDVLRDGQNGVVFRRGDAAALAQSLLELCRERSKSVLLGKAARQTIVSSRTWLHNVDMFLAPLSAS